MKNNMKRILSAALLVMMVVLPLTGCFRDVLYGNWSLAYTSNVDGTNQSKPPIAVAMTLEKDGTCLLYGSYFGTFTMDRDEFTLTMGDEPGDTSGGAITGAWEMLGSNLVLYPDSDDIMYVFNKVEATAE